MKTKIASFVINNAEDLHNAVTAYVSGRHLSETLIEGPDRLEVFEETLSDQSTVFSIGFAHSTAAQRKREKE